MSSTPGLRQPPRRIVPAIPHQLAARRAKVMPESKSDRQAVDKAGKKATATAPIVESRAQTPPTNGVDQGMVPDQDAHKGQESEAIQVPVEEKETNGLTAPPPPSSHQDVQARPFVPRHQMQRSESLVFGGLQDSSSASPANPSAMFMPPPSVPPMGHPLPLYENYYPPPHYAPAPLPAPPMPWGAQVNGHAFPLVNGHGHGHGNGMSPSPSQTSSMAHGDSGIVTPDAHAQLKHHAPPPSFRPPPIDANVKHLLDFILAQFGKSELADYVLELPTGGQDSKPLVLPVHSFIIARCPSLLNILQQLPSTRTYTGMVVYFPQSYYFQEAPAFADALRFIYGGPLLDPALLISGTSLADSSASRMRYTLSYLAAGHCLDAPSIAGHAASIASELLSWETLETLLSFAVPNSSRDDGQIQPFYGFYAGQLLYQALDFIVMNLSHEFALDTSVSELSLLPRLPQSYQSTPNGQRRASATLFATPDGVPTQRPISGIRFGQATPAESDAPLPAQILSAVLVSLPFNLLKPVLEHHNLKERLGLDTMQLIAGDVVRERERRRTNIVNALQDKSLADEVLFWSESVARDVTGTRLNLIRNRTT